MLATHLAFKPAASVFMLGVAKLDSVGHYRQYSLIHARHKNANYNSQNKFDHSQNTQINTRFGHRQIILGLRITSTLTVTFFFWYCYVGIAMRDLRIQYHIFITVNSVVYTPHRVSLY